MTIERKTNEEQFGKYKQGFSNEDQRYDENKEKIAKNDYDFKNNDKKFSQHDQKSIPKYDDQRELNVDFFEKSNNNNNTTLFATIAQRHSSINIPWDPNQIILPGTLFHSSLHSTKDPWSKESCFVEEGEEGEGFEEERTLNRDKFKVIYLPIDGGASGTFKSISTEGSTKKQDHQNFFFKAEVNLGFCSASASLIYDKVINDNKDDYTVSSRSSYRCGSVLVRQTPSLKPEAARILKYEGGLDRFEKKYGDYYVSGYNIGADNTMTISTDSSLLTNDEKKIITAEVKSFLFDISFTKEFKTNSLIGQANLRSIGYDTLLHKNIDESMKWGNADPDSFKEFQAKTKEMVSKAYALPTRVEEAAKEQGLLTGIESLQKNVKSGNVDNSDPYEQEIDPETCKKLIHSNLVVEVVLMPIRTLRDVQYWSMEDDVI